MALLRIGEPAMPMILISRMGHALSDRQVKIFAYVVRYHYAPQREEEVGLFRMERLLERAKAEREKYAKKRGLALGPSVRETNLSRLIEIYKTINPHEPKDWPRPPRSPDEGDGR